MDNFTRNLRLTTEFLGRYCSLGWAEEGVNFYQYSLTLVHLRGKFLVWKTQEYNTISDCKLEIANLSTGRTNRKNEDNFLSGLGPTQFWPGVDEITVLVTCWLKNEASGDRLSFDLDGAGLPPNPTGWFPPPLDFVTTSVWQHQWILTVFHC